MKSTTVKRKRAKGPAQQRTKLDTVRAQIPCLAQYVPMNVGTSGPLPRVAVEAMVSTAKAELNCGRHLPNQFPELRERKESLRRAFGRIINAPAGSIALTHHTTDGMNIAAHAFQWRPGDEVITTTIEHVSGLLPLALLRERHGVTVRLADVGLGGGDVAGAIEALITSRTRLIALSHVSYSTGALLPLPRIVAAARRHSVAVLADAAQSAGAVQVDVQDLGVDLYAMPGQKWLCGPEGTGALYVRPQILPELQLTFAGYSGMRGHDQAGYYLPQPGAQRFEVGAMNWPALAGLEASLNWLEAEVGRDWAHERIGVLARLAKRHLASIPGVTVLTPDNMAGLVSFRVEGVEPAPAVAWLWERGYQIRSIPELGCLRLSAGFFLTEEEVTALCNDVETLAKKPPALRRAASV